MTAIYYTRCQQLPDHIFDEAVFSLPIEMQQKIQKYRRWEEAHACLYGKLLLKEAISQLGYDYSLALIQENKYGKPYFKDSDFGFNISHSGEYIVCVISTDEKQNLGIDIEENKPIVLEDFNNVFTKDEQKEISEQGNFQTFWTRKEAVAKADGRGILIPFNTIDTLNLSVVLDNKRYALYEVEIDHNYTIYMAASVSLEKEVKCFYKDPGSLY